MINTITQTGADASTSELVEPSFYATHGEFIGAVSMWAIAQSPLFPPRNLTEALTQVFEATYNDFKGNGGLPMKQFSDRRELRRYLEPILEACPLIMDWNRSHRMVEEGRYWNDTKGNALFISADSGPGPEDDFVDMGALAQNVSNYFHVRAKDNKLFEDAFAAKYPSPPPVTELKHIPMRDDPELPTEMVVETFEEWVARTAEPFSEPNPMDENLDRVTVWRSRVDGGFMGLRPADFSFLFKAGITERIQMMDAEAGKTACIGFNPKLQKWFGWARGMAGFGIGYVVKEGDIVTQTGWTAECLAAHPERDYRIPAGFEAKTLVDAKRLAIAFAESLS